MSADNPDRLRGNYLDGVVLDEFGHMRSSIWGEVIRLMLADRQGWATFIGTPTVIATGPSSIATNSSERREQGALRGSSTSSTGGDHEERSQHAQWRGLDCIAETRSGHWKMCDRDRAPKPP